MIDTLRTFLENLTMQPDIPLFLMRAILGGLFIYEFFFKIKDIPGFAKSHKLPVPVAYGLSLAELTGGIGLLLGVWTQIAGLVIMGVMVGSIYFHVFVWNSPYWANKSGWEYDLMIFVMAMVIVATGGGDIALAPTL